MQIELLVQKIHNLKDEIKAIDGAIKDETPQPEELEKLKSMQKDINKQVKEMKEDIERQTNENEGIHKLREEKVLKEEEFAETQKQLFDAIQLNNKEFSIDVPLGEKVIKVQTQKTFNVFFNGKELKKKK